MRKAPEDQPTQHNLLTRNALTNSHPELVARSSEIVVAKSFAIIAAEVGTYRRNLQKKAEMAKITQEMMIMTVEFKKIPWDGKRTNMTIIAVLYASRM